MVSLSSCSRRASARPLGGVSARRSGALAALVFLALACESGHAGSRGKGGGSAAAPTPAPAPAPALPPEPPPPDPAAQIAAGAGLYTKYCQLCHGPDAKGYAADNAPSLVSDTFLRSATDQFLFIAIARGRPGTPMAPYSSAFGGPMNDDQLRQLVAFLRSKGPAAETLTAVADGDPKSGEKLFAKHCQKCHGNGPKRTAPRLDMPELLQIATNSFLEYAIRKGRPDTPMVAYEGKLTQAQINDLVSYLRMLEHPRPAAMLDAPTGKEPMVMNPKGKAPTFDLREGRFASAAQVAAAFKAKKRMVILDARATSDWMLGHIPGAISMPYYEMKRIDEVPKDGTWVLAYCACPHHASGEVVDELRRRGYSNTAVIDEGINFWRQQKYPMIEATPAGSAAPAGAPPAPHAPH